MYDDIYKGLSEEQKLRLLKADIPKFEVVGEFEMTDEMKEEAKKTLDRLIKEFQNNAE